MADVFVSYKAEDRKRVKPLVEALEADGYSVWWDEQIGGGAQWRHMIEAELNSAKCVIVAWSKRSVGPEGTFVQDEAARAQQRHVYVPVTIDKVHLPLGFGENQALPLTGWRGSRSDPQYVALLSAVRRIIGDEGRDSTRAAVPHLNRRAALAGGAVAAAAVVGVGGWTLFRTSSASASRSIAVLPFANLSGDPSQAYFSDGVAEEIRSALARIAGLQVVGRTSSEAVRNDDAKTAAKKLGVANILTGSVRESPSTVRVSAELIDGTNGLDRWSQDYDRSPGDAIKIQMDIAANVAGALSAALGAVARAAITVGGTSNAEAQKLVFQANELTYRFTKNSSERAQELVDAALELDPNYAHAYALKALILLAIANEYARGSNELSQGRVQAVRNAQIAIRLAPNLPIAHGALAEIYRSDLSFAPALEEYKRVFALASGLPDALRSYAGFLGRLGNAVEATRLVNQAITLDRLNPASYGVRSGILFYARRYPESVKLSEELKRNSPELFDHPISFANNLQMAGRFDEARRSYAEGPPDDPIRLVGEAVLAARTGDRAGALKTMDVLNRLYADSASYQFGEIHAQLSEPDDAIAALQRGWEIKDAGLLSMKVGPWLDPIRGDSRFAALLQKVNFPA